MAKTAVKAKTDEVEVFQEIEQGSAAWHEIRRGIPSASRFKTIMADGRDGNPSETRRKLMNIMAGEIITEEVAETFRSEAMERGVEMEPELRDWYGRTRFADIAQVGFVKRTVHNPLGSTFAAGCSPDALVAKDGVLEIKTTRPDLLIELMERGAGGFPPTHRAQCQGALWVTGRAWCDLIIGYRGMPKLAFRIERDDAYIASLTAAVEVFDYELRALVAKVRKIGTA